MRDCCYYRLAGVSLSRQYGDASVCKFESRWRWNSMLELAVLLTAISTVPTVYATVFANDILSTGDCDISHDSMF